MKIFCRFDGDRESKSFSDVKLLICVDGARKEFEGEYYDTFNLLVNSCNRYSVVTDVLDFEVL